MENFIIISKDENIGEVPSEIPFTKYKYFDLRDCVWNFILENNITELPINMFKLLKDLNILTLPYSKLYKLSENLQTLCKKRIHLNAFTIYNNKKSFIFYNEELNKETLNFSLAHELGHLIRLHNIKNYNYEKEANMFAERLLMPMIVIKKLELGPNDISIACKVSLYSATLRHERFLVISPREKFLSSPLEKKSF